ncbi:type I methionyl aminopeptidase [Candidatus Nitrospira neomarina]|jgi:methionyl aminopeptidase|uniref:Methionine aminopeptidase n=1 Tax=Candidatus Nitrospira neomarina TaxID=3020899 RepID=A0AA96GK14_9BACT|nr:type I methionyl aminopeptidase [Candidatus Nitrospira neomarina]WNM61670.1 type I methionyl aminopeptidase [Candidatus Nitrospira neomarina]
MIIIKTAEEIELIARAGKIVTQCHQLLVQEVKPGITTLELDRLTEECILDLGGIPAFKGYRNYPNSLCASINEEVVHGIPSKRELKDGDIIGLDVGAIVEGFYGDGAVTVSVGAVPENTQSLVAVTQEALHKGIEQAVVGNRLSDISFAIQTHVERHGYSVVRDFVGHGIGRQLHEEPQVPNYGRPGQGPRLKPGMALAIEPMVNLGGSAVKVLKDGWTAVTCDRSLSAHFEHTITIEANGPPRILTGWS